MNAGPFYIHESEDRIMLKKDKVELSIWLEQLEGFKEETEYLQEMEDQFVGDPILFSELQQMRRKIKLKAADFYRYDLIIMSSIECDNMQCDAFYLNTHERHREEYVKLLREYRSLKRKIFTNILLKSRP